MAAITATGSVVAGNGLGPKTHVLSVATGSNMAGCVAEAQVEGFTIAAVEGVADGNHVMVQGGPGGAEAVSGISLVATFDNAS